MKIDMKLFGMIILDYLVFLIYSLPMAFFPLIAKRKGVTES
jgi:hypothetical protein